LRAGSWLGLGKSGLGLGKSDLDRGLGNSLGLGLCIEVYGLYVGLEISSSLYFAHFLVSN